MAKFEALKVEDFKGKVLLIDFWTFECWNCYRSFPWLNSLEKSYHSKGLEIVGIHSPEFEREKKRNAIQEKMKAFKLKHPVMMDNDFAYWHAFNNQYWPAFYLIDAKGEVRYRFVGEVHTNTAKAKSISQAVEKLLKEAGAQ